MPEIRLAEGLGLPVLRWRRRERFLEALARHQGRVLQRESVLCRARAILRPIQSSRCTWLPDLYRDYVDGLEHTSWNTTSIYDSTF